MSYCELTNIEEIKLKRVEDGLFSLEIDTDIYMGIDSETTKKCTIKAGLCRISEKVNIDRKLGWVLDGDVAYEDYNIPLNIQLLSDKNDKVIFTIDVPD